VSTSPIVAAVVSVAAVMPPTFCCTKVCNCPWTACSCSALTCSGPFASQPDSSLMLCPRLAPSWGTPPTTVRTTKVSSTPSAARPPTSTIAVARPRGTRHWTSRPTAGASSAASSRAIATGMTIPDR
jgi:hypothetical protein